MHLTNSLADVIYHLAENLEIQVVKRSVERTFVPTLIAHVIVAFTLAFSPPQNRFLRLAASGITSAYCLETIRRSSLSSYESSSFADYMFGLAFHTNCYLVLLNRSPPPTLTSAWQKLQWGINALFSPRMGTKPYRRDPPNTSKLQFLLRRAIVALIIGTFWLYVRDGTPFYPHDTNAQDWAEPKTHLAPQILNRTLTLRDIRFRLVLAFYAYAGSALTICGAHTICALVAVGIFNSPHHDWPPLFGNILEAYTLRRWYSHFWHQAMRKAFTIHAVVLAETGLGLRKHTVSGRSVILLLSFLFSGIMHTVTSDLSHPCADRFAAIRLFLGFGVAILLEQALQFAYIAVHDVLRVPWTRAEFFFWRCFGYCWVAYYLLEFTITGSFRFLQCSQGEAGTE